MASRNQAFEKLVSREQHRRPEEVGGRCGGESARRDEEHQAAAVRSLRGGGRNMQKAFDALLKFTPFHQRGKKNRMPGRGTEPRDTYDCGGKRHSAARIARDGEIVRGPFRELRPGALDLHEAPGSGERAWRGEEQQTLQIIAPETMRAFVAERGAELGMESVRNRSAEMKTSWRRMPETARRGDICGTTQTRDESPRKLV